MFRPKRLTAHMTEKPFLSGNDLHYFNEGSAVRLYEKLGAHAQPDGGVHFCVWAPNATKVTVSGDFNGWNKSRAELRQQGTSGLWAGRIADAQEGQLYKYNIYSSAYPQGREKADPFAFEAETPPGNASRIRCLDYVWQDQSWMKERGNRQTLQSPISIYEVHLGSWRRRSDGRQLSYREIADELVPYVKEMGFTHVEFLPVMEHPFEGSWGYQITNYYAACSRFGTPQDFMFLIDRLHQAGIGVILDWVPSHFAVDGHALGEFDGTSLYEHHSSQQGFHPDWGSFIFNYGRNEVKSFLISNALFWLDKFHVDALRVDAVASMLYLDYSRKEGEWVPNMHGGAENLEAIDFIRQLNAAIYLHYPDVQVIAEESTAWPGVSRPVHHGGLGFGMKWDMGWMNDNLSYFSRPCDDRKHHHNDMTFRGLYAFSENFVLPLSHDEVVHGKKPLIEKMSGSDDWQKFANLRCMLSYMFALPGKKLLFMGTELAQRTEWDHDRSLGWHLLEQHMHAGIQRLIRDLNRIYTGYPALHLDCNEKGFNWIDASDHKQSILSFSRHNEQNQETAVCIFNMTPATYANYELGIPLATPWKEIFNSDDAIYGGSGQVNKETLLVRPQPRHGQAHHIVLRLPPLGGVILVPSDKQVDKPPSGESGTL